MLLQTTTPSVVQTVVQTAIALVVPTAATFGLTQVSKMIDAVNKMPDWEKRLLVTVYSVVVTGIAHALNIKLPDAWGALSSVDIQALLTACSSFVIYRIFKPAPVTPVK